MPDYRNSKLIPIICTIVLCLGMQFLFYDVYLTAPNQFVFNFGGDPLFLYFNTVYHACYGDGMMLSSMNYPWGESIFMTDAQGSLSILLTKLNHIGIDTCSYAVGVIHSLSMGMISVCAVFLFLILSRLQIATVWSVLFAIAITLLAPQMMRINMHFGLGYPFFIPMCIYWTMRKLDIRKWEIKDVFFIAIIIFFFLNNPYIGFSGFLYVPLIALIAMYREQINKSFLIQWFCIVTAILFGVFIFLKFHDPFSYRIKEQWGFFNYNMEFQGLLFNKYGLLHEIISSIKQLRDFGLERSINLGLIPTLMVVGSIFYWVYLKAAKSEKRHQWIPNQIFGYIMLAGVFMALVAFNGNLPFFPQSFAERHLGPILLFKASGRFIWLFYYVVAIWSAWKISMILQSISKKHTTIVATSIALLIASIWLYEGYHALSLKNNNNRHANMFLKKGEYASILSEENINPDEYQAILALPLMQGWASKFMTDLHWRSQFESTMMSMATGLPIIDGMLSRMSLDHTMKMIQLVSHPLIERELLNDFPNDKPILLMDMSEGNMLPDHQSYVVSKGQLLTKQKNYSLYKLPIDSLRISSDIVMARQHYSQFITDDSDSIFSEPILSLSYNTQQDEAKFYGNGSNILTEGTDTLLTYDFESLATKDSVEVSFWIRITNDKYGMPNFVFEILDINNKVEKSHTVYAATEKNVQGDWLRISHDFTITPSNKLRISFTSNQDIIADELLIRNVSKPMIVDDIDSPFFLYNNYKIRK